MGLSFSADQPQEVVADWLLILSVSSPDPVSCLRVLDQQLAGSLSGLFARSDYEAHEQELLPLYQTSGIRPTNILLCGCGPVDSLHQSILRRSLLAGLRRICSKPSQTVAIWMDPQIVARFDTTHLAEIIGDCVVSAPVDASVCRKDQKHSELRDVVVCGFDPSDQLDAAAHCGQVIGSAANLIKDLVNRPANEIYPETFCDRVAALTEAAGMSCQVMDEADLRRERMGALLAVAQGSDRPPRLLVLHYQGSEVDGPQIALVGKGVTFDSGGYSLKPTDGMLTMKCDMAGAATVVAAGLAIAQLGLPINLTVYAGLVENMVSGRAFKLGDVITARTGTTIEIHNTDAEGRLVLADVLSFAVDQGASRIVDLATLTGACVVALGEDVSGLFSNNAELSGQLIAAAERAGEGLWAMPMYRQYEELLKSDVADLKNIGGRWGGAITAAKFLQHFVGDTEWAHIDIAGPSFATSSNSWRDSGATAHMLRTLIDWVRETTGHKRDGDVR